MKTKSPAQQLEFFLLVLYKKRELAEIPKALCVSIGTLLCTVALTPFVVTPLIGLLVAISQPSLNMSIPSVLTALVGFSSFGKLQLKARRTRNPPATKTGCDASITIIKKIGLIGTANISFLCILRLVAEQPPVLAERPLDGRTTETRRRVRPWYRQEPCALSG